MHQRRCRSSCGGSQFWLCDPRLLMLLPISRLTMLSSSAQAATADSVEVQLLFTGFDQQVFDLRYSRGALLAVAASAGVPEQYVTRVSSSSSSTVAVPSAAGVAAAKKAGLAAAKPVHAGIKHSTGADQATASSAQTAAAKSGSKGGSARPAVAAASKGKASGSKLGEATSSNPPDSTPKSSAHNAVVAAVVSTPTMPRRLLAAADAAGAARQQQQGQPGGTNTALIPTPGSKIAIAAAAAKPVAPAVAVPNSKQQLQLQQPRQQQLGVLVAAATASAITPHIPTSGSTGTVGAAAVSRPSQVPVGVAAPTAGPSRAVAAVRAGDHEQATSPDAAAGLSKPSTLIPTATTAGHNELPQSGSTVDAIGTTMETAAAVPPQQQQQPSSIGTAAAVYLIQPVLADPLATAQIIRARVRATAAGFGNAFYAILAAQGVPCQPAVYLDGAQIVAGQAAASQPTVTMAAAPYSSYHRDTSGFGFGCYTNPATGGLQTFAGFEYAIDAEPVGAASNGINPTYAAVTHQSGGQKLVGSVPLQAFVPIAVLVPLAVFVAYLAFRCCCMDRAQSDKGSKQQQFIKGESPTADTSNSSEGARLVKSSKGGYAPTESALKRLHASLDMGAPGRLTPSYRSLDDDMQSVSTAVTAATTAYSTAGLMATQDGKRNRVAASSLAHPNVTFDYHQAALQEWKPVQELRYSRLVKHTNARRPIEVSATGVGPAVKADVQVTIQI